jgi:hypothetical protein
MFSRRVDSLGVLGDALDIVGLFQNRARKAADRGERIADFVRNVSGHFADGRQLFAMHDFFLRLAQAIETVLQLAICFGVFNRERGLRGEERQKLDVIIGNRAARVQIIGEDHADDRALHDQRNRDEFLAAKQLPEAR